MGTSLNKMYPIKLSERKAKPAKFSLRSRSPGFLLFFPVNVTEAELVLTIPPVYQGYKKTPGWYSLFGSHPGADNEDFCYFLKSSVIY